VVRIVIAVACTAAALLLLAAPGPAASKSFKFEGRTSQCPADQGRCGDVAIRLSGSLRRVTSFFIEFQARCENASSPVSDSITAHDIPTTVAAHTVKFTAEDTSTLDLGNGFTGDVTAKLAGRIRAASGNGSGTLELDIAVKDGSGRQVDTCSTGRLPVGWKVKVV
jgi:hypothetical protein